MPPDDETLSNQGPESQAPAARPRQFLLVVMEMEDPLAPPCLYGLEALDEVLLGRGASRVWSRQEHEGRRQLVLQLPDRWMSREHARLMRAGDQWMLEDVNSKNGLRVNDEPRTRGWLADGDLLELGHTLLLFRETASTGPAFAPDASAGEPRVPVPGFATMNPGLLQELAKLARVARTPVPVVLEGETGTGKELLARAYHALSERPGEFVAVNCGALPDTLVQSELFGYRKGAFSGASEDRLGLVRSSDRGTLFLDEIGELPLPAQASLLRVLQESEVLPVGGTRPLPVDLRVVAATNRDLGRMVREGTFRSDLLARLSGLRLWIPPLRERREDLGLLVAELLRRLVPPGARSPSFTPAAARALFRHDWPRNVRELEHGLALAVALSPERIDLEHLPAELQAEPPGRATKAEPPKTSTQDQERDELLTLLRKHRGNVSQIAEALGTSRAQVHRLFKRHGLDPQGFRS
ncbi:sigma 54-interacting transcriptional regulator [Archangium lansingense]|uniref:sigma 54-interacting transcriptional regulator n=1 Tax=Archangium lansingense TaxID=2995310 RepID=UPI003B768D5A